MAAIDDEMEKEVVLLLIEGKEESLKRVNKKLKNDPDDVWLKNLKDYILNFDRKEFIDSW